MEGAAADRIARSQPQPTGNPKNPFGLGKSLFNSHSHLSQCVSVISGKAVQVQVEGL